MIYVTDEFIENLMDTMSDRLRQARIEAGFKKASEAARHFGWTKSTYIAHENGQNEFGVEQAQTYGKAFKKAPEWLLLGIHDAMVTPGIDRQLLTLPPAESKALIDRFNAMIEGVKAVRKLS